MSFSFNAGLGTNVCSIIIAKIVEYVFIFLMNGKSYLCRFFSTANINNSPNSKVWQDQMTASTLFNPLSP